MAHAYTPGLRVTERATVRKERRLPIAGRVLAEAGARVRAEDVVARAARWRGREGIRAFAVRHLSALSLSLHAVTGQELTLRAAALTYRTLLALVPTLALAFAVFGAFGGLSRLKPELQQLVAENLAVGRSEEVGKWLDQFVENVDIGGIAGVAEVRVERPGPGAEVIG